MARISFAQAMRDLEQLMASVTAQQPREVARLRAQLERQLIEYKATKALRSTLEEARQEMTIRLHDKLRRLRASGRRLKAALLEQHEERNPELLLYEGAPIVATTVVKKTAKKSAARRAERSKRPARSGERCRRCRSKK